MESTVTRRQLAVAFGGGVILLGQTPVPPLPGNPEAELKAARDQCRQYGEQLGKFALPISTEPAFQFKA